MIGKHSNNGNTHPALEGRQAAEWHVTPTFMTLADDLIGCHLGPSQLEPCAHRSEDLLPVTAPLPWASLVSAKHRAFWA